MWNMMLILCLAYFRFDIILNMLSSLYACHPNEWAKLDKYVVYDYDYYIN